MDLLHSFWHLLLNLILNTESTLDALVTDYGKWVYAILFAVIFCETGLVVTPFLPGDSILFLAAMIAHRTTNDLHIGYLIVVILVAAIVGDAVNYFIGYFFGLKLFSNPKSKVFKHSYLTKTNHFYAKYGGKTIILARFIPIVRTFAPFVAGMGRMNFKRFFSFNIIGGVLWTLIFTLLGFFVGGLPFVQHNLKFVVVFIIVVSILPGVFGVLKAKYLTKKVMDE